MDLNVIELAESATTEGEIGTTIRELGDLELTIVGGGCGEIIVG